MVKSVAVILDKKRSGPESPVSAADKRRAAILDCADAVFLEQGFQAASMSAIALRLGGSKGTLYNYFPSKEELFIACVSRHCIVLQEQMSAALAADGDLAEALNQVGRRHMGMVLSDDLVRKFRMIVAEAERAPELGRTFYDMGPANGLRMLSAHLERAMARGEIRRADPYRAAQHFFGLCNNGRFKARLCNSEPSPTPAQVEEEVADAVRVFMAGYAPH